MSFAGLLLASLLSLHSHAVPVDDASSTVPMTDTSMAQVEDTTTKPTEDCCVDQMGWEACIVYQLESCQGIYAPWASVRCQAFCGMCKPCKIEPCEDRFENCERYGDYACTSEGTRIWAYQNCRKHCGLCTNYGFYNQIHNITDEPVCVDKVNHCAEYGKDDCNNFPGFMREHCSKYCGFCKEPTTTPAVTEYVPSTTVSAGSTVSGQCGDVLPNCSSTVRKENCCGLNAHWAEDNCAEYCGYCGVVPDRQCTDTLDHCDRENPEMCTSDLYDLFRQNNCAGFCKLCDQPWQPPSCTAHLFQTPEATTQSEVHSSSTGSQMDSTTSDVSSGPVVG